jgi:outer membrane lipoprotein SlyB
LLVLRVQGRLNLCQSIATGVIVSKRNVVVPGAARSAIGTFGGSLADIEPA